MAREEEEVLLSGFHRDTSAGRSSENGRRNSSELLEPENAGEESSKKIKIESIHNVTETEETKEQSCLACARCNHPLVFKEDVIVGEFPTLRSHVFSYEFDLFNDEIVCTAYSATNTSDHRFDVARFEPTRVIERVRISGQPTDEHTWFPPYKWCFTSCLMCSAHLGWAFYSSEASSDGSEQQEITTLPDFFALILTYMRPRQCKVPTSEELQALREPNFTTLLRSRLSRTRIIRHLLSSFRRSSSGEHSDSDDATEERNVTHREQTRVHRSQESDEDEMSEDQSESASEEVERNQSST